MSAGFFRLRDWLQMRDWWAWWSGEIAQLLPSAVRRRLVAVQSGVTIEIGGDETIIRHFAGGTEAEVFRGEMGTLDGASLSRLLAPYRPSRIIGAEPVVILLAGALTLNRTTTLPWAARKNLPDILRHEVERQSPIDANLVYYDYRIVGTDQAAKLIEVDLRLVERARLEPVTALCREARIGLAAISFVEDEHLADGGNFPVDSRAALGMHLRLHIGLISAMVALVLVFVLAGGLYVYNAVELGRLEQQAEAAANQALVVERLSRDIALSTKRENFLNEQKKSALVVGLLSEVSRILPMGTWLSEFEYGKGEIRIHGFSKSAASLVPLFDTSPRFYGAQFRAPLMQGPAPNSERFDMSFRVRDASR